MVVIWSSANKKHIETYARKYGESKHSVIFHDFLKNEVNSSRLLTDFLSKLGRIQAFLIRHIFRAKVSIIK